MNNNSHKIRAKSHRKLPPTLQIIVGLIFAGSNSGAALAQTALTGSDLVLPTTAAPTADMTILKTASAGGFDRFSIVVTNTGSVAVTGATVTDSAGSGGACPKSNPVTITGSGVPEGSFTIASLTGAGIALGTLNPGQSATLTYSCKVN